MDTLYWQNMETPTFSPLLESIFHSQWNFFRCCCMAQLKSWYGIVVEANPPLQALLIACHIVGEGARNSTRVYMTFQCGYQSSRAIARGAGLKFNCNFRNSRITLLCAECKERQINFAFCFCSSQWQCTRKKKSAQHKASGEAKKKTAQIVAK